MSTILRVSFCSVCDGRCAKFQEHCFNIFQRYFLFSILLSFSCKPYDFITDLICIIGKRVSPKMKKDISKRKLPFFCISKGLSNKQ